MQFSELVQKRYSVRSYKNIPIEDAKLNQVLQAAVMAPTAANRQPFQLIVIHTAGREAELKRIYDRPWFIQAPVVICACTVPAQGWVRRDGRKFADVDLAIAVDHLILQATDLGLGTCWVAAFNFEAAREVLHLPPEVEPIVCIPLGYPNSEPPAKKRKTLPELVKYEHW